MDSRGSPGHEGGKALHSRCIHFSPQQQQRNRRAMTATTTTSQSQRQSKYTAAELSSHFLSFYQFLTTLHYSPADLKVPPPAGWPHLSSPTRLASWNLSKSPFALQVLAHLPYFTPYTGSDANNNPGIHYKSALVDYTSSTLLHARVLCPARWKRGRGQPRERGRRPRRQQGRLLHRLGT